jgi:predicted enzyme related to lactoylglutathione lyase
MNHKGIELFGEEGALCWADLSTPDPDTAKTFYEALFDWKIAPGQHDPSGYLHIQNGDDFIGGIQTVAQRNPHAPPHWLIYIQTADCDGAVLKAQSLSARVLMPPVSIPNTGRFAVLADPQGAVFALYEPLAAA